MGTEDIKAASIEITLGWERSFSTERLEAELACGPCEVRWKLRDGAACWSCGKPGTLPGDEGIYPRFHQAPRPPDSGHLDDGTSAAGEDRA